MKHQLIALLFTAAACAPALDTPPDPRAWSPVRCEACDTAGVRVEARRSVTHRGEPGQYVLARVSNLNAHPIAFTLDVVTRMLPSGDPDLPGRQWKVMLPAAPHAQSSTVLMADFADIEHARVHGVERLER